MEIDKEELTIDNRGQVDENNLIKSLNELFRLHQRKAVLNKFDFFIQNCNDAAFLENCIKWLQCCCKVDGVKTSEQIAGLILFRKIITLSAEFPELGRQVSNSITNRFLDVFSKCFCQYREGWLSLETFLLKYHGSLTSHKVALENLFLNSINKNVSISVEQAKCFALFPLAGGGGAKNSVYKANWREQFVRILNSSHNLLNLMFKDAKELHTYDVSNCATVDFTHSCGINQMVETLNSYGLIIQSMLLGQYPTTKMIPVDAVLKLISRCLSITETTLKNSTILQTAELCQVLPIVHCNMMDSLSALIVACKMNLLPVSATISKLLEQALLNVSISSSVKLALCSYSCLSNWLTTAQGSCCANQLFKSLIPALLDDIQQKNDTVLLRGKNKLKDPIRDKLNQFVGDEKLCFAALKTIEVLINSLGYKLEAHQHKIIQSVVFEIAYNIVRLNSLSKWVYNSSVRCREALLLVVIQLCLEPCPQWPPPTQYALKILKMGLNDSNPSIVKTCWIGSSILQRIIYPEFSIGSFPATYKASNQEADNQVMNVNINVSNLTTEDLSCKESIKLVTKSSSPWQSLSFKKKVCETSQKNYDEIIIGDDMEGEYCDSLDDGGVRNVTTAVNKENNTSPIKTVTPAPAPTYFNIDKSSENMAKKRKLVEEVSDGLTKNNYEITRDVVVSISSFDTAAALTQCNMDQEPKNSNSVLGRNEASLSQTEEVPYSILSESSGDSIAKEGDSPMSLRSGTILVSLSPLDGGRQTRRSSVSPIDSKSALEMNSSSSVRRESNEVAQRKRSASPSSQNSRAGSVDRKLLSELDSPMSLRSGTLLGSSQSSIDSTRHVRSASVTSQSSVPCPEKPAPSPVREEEEEAFDDTLNADFF